MKLGVCVPYRNREQHLAEFSPRVHKFLEDRGIEHKIYFAHQCDDKLFNRGKMKNIAADIAFKDGCDYIVWHDIDMIPEDGSCDYSYNPDSPKHLAVRISQTDYNLKYEEYFGGAVLFTKEQVERTNGYSNDYWDWGMEDDDLFWRCVINGYADQTFLQPKYRQKIAHFNGNNSSVEIPVSRNIRGLCSRSHTVSILVKAEQQLDKAPLYLIGDTDRRFVEYPILRRPGYDWGLSYNNSRAYTTMLWNYEKEFLYMWMKRYEEQWTWVTLTVDDDTKEIRLYLNGKESDSRFGTGVPSPLVYNGLLKRYASEPYILGTTNSLEDKHPAKWFKGDIAKVIMWDRCLTQSEIKESILGEPNKEDLQLYYDFSKSQFGLISDLSGNDNYANTFNIEEREDEIAIPHTILPFRRDGKFECLPHQTEGLINVGGVDKWAKGETTARNERRYVLQMQKGEYDWQNDGMNTLKYELLSIDDIGNNSVMINCKC